MKTTKTNRAQIAPVTIAGTEFQGVMYPDGEYGITLQQTHRTLTTGLTSAQSKISVRPDHAQRSLERLLGKDSVFASEYIENNPRTQRTLTIPQFWGVLRKLDRLGNPVASAFIDACGETTLEMYLDVAFGIEKDARERVLWNEMRAAGILARNNATDALRDHLLSIGVTPQAHHYIRLTELLNKAALGFTAQEYKLTYNLPTKTNMRDFLSKEHIKALEFAEELFVRRLNKTNEWTVALQQTVELI